MLYNNLSVQSLNHAHVAKGGVHGDEGDKLGKRPQSKNIACFLICARLRANFSVIYYNVLVFLLHHPRMMVNIRMLARPFAMSM